MQDRDMTGSEADEDAKTRDENWDRESKTGEEAVREEAAEGHEDDDAVVRKEEYGSRPA